MSARSQDSALRRRPIARRIAACAALLGLLFAGAAFAQELCPTQVPAESPPPFKPSNDDRVYVKADRVNVENKSVTVFTGNVQVTYQDRELVADEVRYNRDKDELTAKGHVHFINRAGDAVDSPFMRIDRTDEHGETGSATFRLSGRRGRGDARKLIFESRDRISMKGARFTSCPVGHDDWFLSATTIDLDQKEQIGSAYNALVRFKGLPLFYWPYLSFPLTNKRKSGFLVPRIGDTGNSGFSVALPYYLNLAPNYDATITPHLLSRRGLQWQNEARYLGEKQSAVVELDYLPNDKIYGADRYAASVTHTYFFDPFWQSSINLQTASDKNYFSDFADSLAVSSQTYLPRTAQVSYQGKIWNALLGVSSIQTLDRTIAPADRPYERVPDVVFSGRLPAQPRRPVYAVNGEFVNFEHQTNVSGTRVTVFPTVSLPFTTSYGFVKPEAGLYHIGYALRNATGMTDPSVDAGVFSLDSGLIFERATRVWGSAYTQTLEPRLFYLYVPYRNQDALPVFDTSVPDFIFTNLFRQNRLVGGDRVGDANQLTAAMTSRLLGTQGEERARLSLGQVFYFAPQRVNLPAGTIDTNRSDIVGEMRAMLSPSWYVRSGIQWRPQTSETEKGDFYLQYHPAADRIINFGHRYTRGVQENVDISTQWPIARRWTLFALKSYSLADRRDLEAYMGLEYRSCCWATRLYLHDRLDQNQNTIRSFMFEFGLTGLVQWGVTPISPLRQDVFMFQ